MPLVPQPLGGRLQVIDAPPAFVTSISIPPSVFPGGVTDEPIRSAELFLGPPPPGAIWLLDSLIIECNSSSLPTCHVAVVPNDQPSLMTDSISRPFGGPDYSRVVATMPYGWLNSVGLEGLALQSGERISVLWVGVTALATAVRGIARLHYRVAVIA